MQSASKPISSAVVQVISSKQDVLKLLKHMLTPYYQIYIFLCLNTLEINLKTLICYINRKNINLF